MCKYNLVCKLLCIILQCFSHFCTPFVYVCGAQFQLQKCALIFCMKTINRLHLYVQHNLGSSMCVCVCLTNIYIQFRTHSLIYTKIHWTVVYNLTIVNTTFVMTVLFQLKVKCNSFRYSFVRWMIDWLIELNWSASIIYIITW